MLYKSTTSPVDLSKTDITGVSMSFIILNVSDIFSSIRSAFFLAVNILLNPRITVLTKVCKTMQRVQIA